MRQTSYFSPRDEPQNDPQAVSEQAPSRNGDQSVPADPGTPQDDSVSQTLRVKPSRPQVNASNNNVSRVSNLRVPSSLPRRPGAYTSAPTNRGVTTGLPRNQTQTTIRTNGRQPEDLMSRIGSQDASPCVRNNSNPGWVDEEYLKRNPWYGQAKDKPVFSLGQPLPRTLRNRQKRQQQQQQRPDSKARPQDADLEQGCGGFTTGADMMTPRPEGDQRPPPIQSRLSEAPERSSSDETIAQPKNSRQEDDDVHQGTDTARKFQVDGDFIGQRDRVEVEEGNTDPNELRNWWARFRAKHPEPMAEFLCTGMSVFLGVAGTLCVNLSANQERQYGSYETACWGWGLSFMFGIYLGGGVSGAHMNPAISVSLSAFRGFPWRQCCIYIIIQTLASFVGGLIAFGLYKDAILNVDPTMTQTYTSFAATPQPWVSAPTAFFSQFAAGAVMLIAVLSLGDDQNNPPGAGMHALILGLLVTTLKMTLGYNTGAALSPANDLGPRLVALLGGYPSEPLFGSGWWVYGPWVATITGALMGCTMYDGLVFVGSESPVNYRWSKRSKFQKKWWWKRKGRHPFESTKSEL